jgi:hypothetical protein
VPTDETPPPSDQEPAADDTVALEPVDESAGQPVQGPGRFDFWIPAMMLVLGLLLGGGLMWIVTDDGSDSGSDTATESASPAPASTVTATSTATDLQVTVPAECLELADNTQEILDLVDQAVTAAGDLDAGALSDVVSELESAQADIEAQSQACQDAAGDSN